jgi:hypothetical protein
MSKSPWQGILLMTCQLPSSSSLRGPLPTLILVSWTSVTWDKESPECQGPLWQVLMEADGEFHSLKGALCSSVVFSGFKNLA